MTSIAFLQNCPRDQITFAMLEELVLQNIPEGLSLEYKRQSSSGLIETIAAFANTYGGLILVGVKDSPGDDRIEGVFANEITRISDACSNLLDPPFVPDIIDLQIPTNESKYLLLIRVFPENSTRPVIMSGKVNIRLPGRNDGADQSRIRQLFSEATFSASAMNSYIQPPDSFSDNPPLNLHIRTGLLFPINPATAGRPFSEKLVGQLSSFLNTSPISTNLVSRLSGTEISGFRDFRKEGFNRARIARISWFAIDTTAPDGKYPIECTVTLNSTFSGTNPPTSMQINFDFILRISAHQIRMHPAQYSNGYDFRVSVIGLYRTLEAILKTITDPVFVRCLSDLGDVDKFLVPRPMSMYINMPYGIEQTLGNQNLAPVQGSGPSYGTHLTGDSLYDLSNDPELHKQIDQWLVQLALDGGLEGMEELLETLHLSD